MKRKVLISAICLFLLSGCASLPEGAEQSPNDPFERLNRATFAFNDTVDQAVLQPVARGYVKVTPSFVRTGVGNFFGNISDVWTAVNSFLQGNAEEGFTGIMRVCVNSTFGLLGLLDVASEAQIPKRRTDFGQTLGVWGVPNGPYLVLPLWGPSVMREAAGLPVDYSGDLWSYYEPVSDRNIGTALRLVDKRAAYLDAYSLLEDAALDKYVFVRDAYIQRVTNQVEMRKNARKARAEEAEMRKLEEETPVDVTDAAEPSEVQQNLTE